LPASGKLATKLFQLHFLRASELFNGGPQGGLQGIFSLNIGQPVVVLPQANAALVTDTVSNLQRLEMLLQSLDKPNVLAFQPKYYTLQNVKASDLVTKIKTLLQGPAQAAEIGSGTIYSADDRTNQVILISDPREYPFFDDLISKLDAPSDPNTNNDVIYLKHADANTLQPILQNLISGELAAQQKTNSATTVRPNGEAATPGGVPALVSAANNALAAALGAGEGGEFSQFLIVAADERSNSIIISGEKSDLVLMRALIAKLDEPIKQVRLQVIIAEVTLSDTDISGIQALNLTVGKNVKNGVSVTNWAGSGGSEATIGTGATQVAGWDFANGVVNPFSFQAMMDSSTMGAKSVVHILSAPVIMAAHGKQSEVNVGEQLPTVTGGQQLLSSAASSPISSSTVSYTNIGIDLTVTPLIGDNGDVQMTIDQKVETVDSFTPVNGVQTPNIGIREAKSFLTAKDGQMLVLGGMQQQQKQSDHSKLGFLFEIPILSQLLGNHTDTLKRTELLFFIRPTIITPDEGTEDAQRRINEMSNRDQVNHFLKDPSTQPDSKIQNFLDRFKGDN
jgi:general secretion pathway protein D